jgi:hypothetical protein
MTFFLKLAAYAFLALMALSALRTGVEGWRYYFGIVLFIVCTLRILMILRQRIRRPGGMAGADAQPEDTRNTENKTPDPPPSSQG